mgnify:CR=1 FL=1
MTDPSSPHEPTDPTGLSASPWPDVPALPAGPVPTDYPSGGYPPYGGPYAPGAQPGYDPQGAYGPQPGYNAPPGYSAPPGYGPVPAYGPPGYPSKSKVAAGILALFLGTLGIHNFYLGYTTRGIIQLVLTITLVGAPISAIWALIEFIMIIMRSGAYGYDASGQPLV